MRVAALELLFALTDKGDERAIAAMLEGLRDGENMVGVRDCPYGICCPWVCGGWDLDALGKFFRRRRRRRPRLRVPPSTNLVPSEYQPSTNLAPT